MGMGVRVSRLREMGGSHEIAVTLSGCGTALVNRPDDQALTTPHVSRCKDAFDIGEELAIFRLGVGAGISFHREFLENGIFRPEKTHG